MRLKHFRMQYHHPVYNGSSQGFKQGFNLGFNQSFNNGLKPY